uniref:F-box associated beta-propeller type 3 domain-containing protein n=1 Tax=Solanum lycopersicum TaxID=4081 RepID=A0A3Q7H7F7_SOLLC
MHGQEERNHVAYAFCFNEASGPYKVLRSVLRNFEGYPSVSEFEVYTIGVDEKWRYVGKAPKPLHESFSNSNVNGVVHWMNMDKNDRIYSFNSWTEKMKT